MFSRPYSYEFETSIPLVTREGVKPFLATGYRQLDARTTFMYGYIGITPGMAMRVTGIGSQYLLATLGDENEKYTGIVNPLNSASTHTMTWLFAL
jgi:hypothetical protein